MGELKWLSSAHERLVFNRRIHKIAESILPFLNKGSVLDVGCGNGELGSLLIEKNDELTIYGIDVLARKKAFIPFLIYRGDIIPFANKSFDYLILIDVLHHLDNPSALLKECSRVVKKLLIVKDHFSENVFDFLLLKGMDWVGNASYKVRLPYNYFSRKRWTSLVDEGNLVERHRLDEVKGMYPWFAQPIMGRRIQFISVLKPDSN